MLGRAAQNYEPAPKAPLDKQMFSSSPVQNGNIQEQLSKSRPLPQSIATTLKGLSKPTKPVNPLRPRSPNIRQGMRQKSESMVSAPQSTGLSSIFSKQDAFQDTQSTAVFSGNSRAMPPKAFVPAQSAVQFDENDFDDDSEIDLDMDFEIPASMPINAQPPPSLRDLETPLDAASSLLGARRVSPNPNPPQNQPSSAITWDSSPPSHKVTPPGATAKRPSEGTVAQETVHCAVEVDPNPRPLKRRTLPWSQNRAEKDEVARRAEEENDVVVIDSPNSSPVMVCKNCKKPGHSSRECPKLGKAAHTPKTKSMPWNTTGSAVREEKKKFKDKRKAAATEAMANRRGKSTPAMAPITLSEEQRRVLDLVVNQQKSAFFTGSAGTGKSVLMRAIIAELRKKYSREPDRVAVTASTGLAACNVGGVTLHSFGGIGLGKEDVPALVKKIKRNPKAKNRWIRTKILIIDEISMVDGDLFDKLEAIARTMRNNGRPFGGIQLVITGDFFQLPPVPEFDNRTRGVKFAFDAGTWSTAIHHTIGLTEVFRQKDPVFANMLNEMRLGKITDETVQAFRKLSRKPNFEDNLDATELFPTRNEVENSNAFRMRDLVGKSYRYDALDTGAITDQVMRDKLLSNMMAPKLLELKKGAQVMLIKNMDDGLVNGSLGKIVAFMNEATFEIYDRNPEIVDEGEERQTDRFSLAAKFSSSKDSKPNTGREYPLVRFTLADGTCRDLLVMPEDWKIELPNGEVQAQRSQLPLILAWALSIHKAQGQTLERVKIDLKRVFEKGQAYVALSRATCQEGLEVHNFDKSKVMAHPRVAQFYNSLYSVNKALQHPKVSAQPVQAEEKHVKKDKRWEYDSVDEAEVLAAYG